MFYLPYSLRSQKSFLAPKGPSIGGAPLLETCLNGSEIKIKVPRNKSRSPIRPLSPRKTYNLRDNDFSRAMTDKSGWEIFPLTARRWDFNGAWFIGNLARLDMYINIVKPLHANPTISFFHPRAFESAIAELMTYYHSDKLSRNDSIQDWFAPVEWKPLKNLPCIAVKFDAIANREVRRDERRRHFFIPLTDQYLLEITFPITRNPPYIYPGKGPEKDTDKWISEEPMKILADQIIDSFQIRLSPEAEQQQAKALAGLCENERALVKEFPPLKWV